MCPGITVQASCHLEWSGPVSVLERVMCLCLVVFGYVWLCLVVFGYVWLCLGMCCVRCVGGFVSVGVDALAVVWW